MSKTDESRSNYSPVVLYFDGTFVHRLNGAQTRVISLIEFLLECGCKLVVYSYSNHVDCPWGPVEIALFHEQFPNVRLVLDQRPSYFHFWKRTKKLLASLFPAAAKMLVHVWLPGVMPDYARLNQEAPDAVWIVNFADGLVELNGIRAETTIVETHDINFLKFSKMFGYHLTSSRMKAKWRSEFALLNVASALIAISAAEAAVFRLFFPEKRVLFVPDYNRPNASKVGKSQSTPEYDAIFVGSDNQFNVDGLCTFVEAYRGFLSTHTLAVAGNVCKSDRVIKVTQDAPNVRLLGYVENLSDLYSKCKVAISPVDGAGVKIKAIEALAEAKPVFGSRHTIEGLPLGYQNCVFPIESIKTSILLTDMAALVTASQAAGSYAAELANAFDRERLREYLRENNACG